MTRTGILCLSVFAVALPGIALEPLSGSTLVAPAEKPLEIKSIQRATKAVAWVNNGWKDNAPCIQVEMRANAEIEGRPFVKAYFYDRTNSLLSKYDDPPQVSEDHRNYSGLPASFKPKVVERVSFPVDEKSKNKWTRVVIVFGTSKYVAAEAYPKDDLSKFNFPEKEQALKSAAPAATPSPR